MIRGEIKRQYKCFYNGSPLQQVTKTGKKN